MHNMIYEANADMVLGQVSHLDVEEGSKQMTCRSRTPLTKNIQGSARPLPHPALAGRAWASSSEDLRPFFVR